MVRTPGRRSLPTLYLVPVSVLCGLLILLGALLDWVPLVPGVLSGRYDRLVFATISWLVSPVDGWTGEPAEPVGGVVGESAP